MKSGVESLSHNAKQPQPVTKQTESISSAFGPTVRKIEPQVPPKIDTRNQLDTQPSTLSQKTNDWQPMQLLFHSQTIPPYSVQLQSSAGSA
jgi:hypothetical protein